MDTIAALDIATIESWLAKIIKFCRLTREAGLPEEVYQRAIDDKDFRAWLVQTCKDKLQPKVIEPPPVPIPAVTVTSYTETFDYTRPLTDVRSDCQLDWYDSNFTQENFPVVVGGEGIVEEEVFVIHLNCDLTDEAALAELDQMGYELVGNTEGVQFATKHKELQHKYPIVFGSAWQDTDRDLSRPCLNRNDAKRGLGLRWFYPGGLWSAYCRFLVRRKRTSVAR